MTKRYPRTLRLDEIREALPEFSASGPEEWVLTVYALHQDGLVSAKLVFADQSYEPIDVINATITEAGRKQRVKVEPSFVAESTQSLGEVPNRQAMLADIASLLRSRELLSVLFIDLDGFKSVNDSLGHQEGDRCLESVVKITSEAILGKGKIYRYGGDEFVVSLPNFVLSEAEATSERIRTAIDRLNPYGSIKVTASIGVAFSDHDQLAKPEELIDAADRALYSAKNAGGNRVSVYAVAPELKKPLPRRTSVAMSQDR